MIALAARPGVSSVPDGRPGLLQSLTQTRAASGPLCRVTDQPGRRSLRSAGTTVANR